MKFADFHVDQVITAGPYRVGEAEIIAFAKLYDPQWFHTDAQASATGFHHGLIASGWHTCGIAMRLAVESALAGSESYASPGLAYVKWLLPVRPGDELTLKATVLEVRRARGKPRLGILRWRWQLHNGTNAGVLDLEATSLFDLPPQQQIAGTPGLS
jgi:acyl dehydratase